MRVPGTQCPVENRSRLVQTCLVARLARQYASVPGGSCGSQKPTAWKSEPRSRIYASQKDPTKASLSAAITARLQHGTEAREYARHARRLALRAVRHRAAGNSADGALSEMRLRVALLQAVHVLRPRQPLRVHAAG